MNPFTNVDSLETIQSQLKDTPDTREQINFLANSIINVMKLIDLGMDTVKISNIARTLVSQEEIVVRLVALYSDIYDIAKRFCALMGREEFDDKNKEIIQKRAVEIVDEQILLIQREVFFKIVNAKENAEGEKNEDGPAMFYPAVEKAKNSIIQHIQAQADYLYPAAVDICKSFNGIAKEYANTEIAKSSEKSKFDTISQAYEVERRIRADLLEDASAEKLRNEEYLLNLIKGFEELTNAYTEKEESLKTLAPESVQNLDQKTSLLKKGKEDVESRVKPLRVLQNLAKRFPRLVKQLDFFAESQYQAKAVLHVLDEVREEMDLVFSRYNLESFTVISFLRYKLNGLSHMYECIHYYYATRQIEADITVALIKRYKSAKNPAWKTTVDEKLEQTRIPASVHDIHQAIATMNDYNFDIHQAFLEYKEDKDLGYLRTRLNQNRSQIDQLYVEVREKYHFIQNSFFTFLIDDLGATEMQAQFNQRVSTHSKLEEVKDVVKSLNTLLATRRNAIDALEKEYAKRFSEKLTSKQISSLAVSKIRKEYLRNLLGEIQPYPYAQELFVEILKTFIAGQHEDKTQKEAEDAVFWMIEKMSPGIMDRFRAEQATFYKKLLNKELLSDRDLTIAFLADNLTPHEIQNFSRVVPGLPKNRLRLETPYGRILLDISRLYQRQIQSKSSSVGHIMERVFEKRERQKLISNIHLLLRNTAEPFLTKIQSEEKKTVYLISLQHWKFRKEFTEMYKYWQYLIQEQYNPGQGMRGYFRHYGDEEKIMMAKYISPDQLNLVEHQLNNEYDIEIDEKLRNVDAYLFELIEILFQYFKNDDRIKSEFEEYEQRKKIQSTNRKKDGATSVLEGDLFMPLIKKRLIWYELQRQSDSQPAEHEGALPKEDELPLQSNAEED